VKTTVLAAARPSASNCFRLFLQEELGRRCARNPRYSLRAFAKYLGIDHATLSQIVRAKRCLTPRTIKKLGARLGLGRDAVDAYLAHVHDGPLPTPALREVQQLAHDAASLVTDWYHHAILELLHLEAFRPDSRWIARVLGLAPDEVNVALTRLVRLGLLEMAARDRWVDKSGDSTVGVEDFTRITIRQLSEQVRNLFVVASKSDTAKPREYSSTTLALSSAHVPAARRLISKFRRELLGLLDRDGPRDDVYRIEISFFPLTSLAPTRENDHGPAGHAIPDSRQGA
jgi:hypothetical protein